MKVASAYYAYYFNPQPATQKNHLTLMIVVPVPPQAFGLRGDPQDGFTCTLNDSIPFHPWTVDHRPRLCMIHMTCHQTCGVFPFYTCGSLTFFHFNSKGFVPCTSMYHSLGIHDDPSQQMIELYPWYPLGIPCLSLRRLGAVEDPTSGLSWARRPDPSGCLALGESRNIKI